MNESKQIRQAKNALRNRFGSAAQVIASAPGRVNLIGGHVDYNDGLAVPMAIERHTWIAGAANGTLQANLFSEQLDEQFSVDLSQPIQRSENGWGNYAAGVLAGFQERAVELIGFDAVIQSDIPIGGGLSSSAALELAIATFVDALLGTAIPKMELALLCKKAENNFANVPCGIMDQFTVALAKKNHLVKIDCQHQSVDWIRWPGDETVVLVVDGRTPHRLVDGEYAARREQSRNALSKLKLNSYRDLDLQQLKSQRSCLSSIEYQRALHVVEETLRAMQFAEFVEIGDWNSAGQLLFESHASLRDNYEVSCRELDAMVEIASRIGTAGGVFGARMTGGGFGGCTVWLVQRTRLAETVSTIQREFDAEFGYTPTVFATSPCDGAKIHFLEGD